MIGKNNPFNIRYNKRNNWLGQIGQKRGFCEFDTLEHGVRAAFILIKGYIERDIDTPRNIIYRFAPPKENPTPAYLDYVCNGPLGHLLDEDKPINSYDDLFLLLSRMISFESGISMSAFDIADKCKFNTDNITNPIKLF